MATSSPGVKKQLDKKGGKDYLPFPFKNHNFTTNFLR